MKRCKIALILGMSAGALSYASAENLTWYGTGTQTWNDGIWRANGNSNVSWKDGSKATFTSSGKADVSIDGEVDASGIVFSDNGRAHSIQGGTLKLHNGSTIEKKGGCGAVISSEIELYHGRQDAPNSSDPHLATCVSGQRAITSNLHGGLAAGYTYSGTNVVYWRNRRLSDISGFVSADFHRNTGAQCLGAKPFFYENNGTTASVQFQYKASDPWTYASKVTFTQRGNDILAKIDYWRARKIPYGEDMSPITPQTQYGEENIGGQTIWDDVSATSGGNWTVSNIIAEENTKNLTFTSEGNSDEGTIEAPNFLRSNGSGTYSGAKTLVFKGRQLSEIEFLSARSVRFSNVNNQFLAKPYNRKVEADGSTSVQFRFFHNSAGSVLCFKVYFSEISGDIYARIGRVGARVIGIDRDWDDADMGFPGYMQQVYDGDLNKTGWGLFDIKATTASIAPLEISGLTELPENLVVSGGEVKLTSANGFAFTNGTISGNGTLHLAGGTFSQSANATSTLSGKLVIDGTKYKLNGATGDKVCGSGAEIEVVNGGEFITTNGAKNAIGSSNVKMYVGLGSKFSENNVNFNLNSVALTVDGGRCELNNASTYIQDLTVRNGAQITESGRAGSYWFGRNSLTPVLTCDGANEVTIAAHLRLFKNEDKAWNPDVQYLTVKTFANLRLTGGFMMAGQSETYYNGMRIRKTGPAKLIFDYSQNDFQHEVWPYTIEQCVDEGTLELAKSAAIVTTQPVSLYGNGSIQVNAGTVNAGGALTVGGENTINIVGNGQISFSSIAFDGNARLNANGDVDNTSFRIGISKCLSVNELSRIRINGHGVRQDDNGYLAPVGFKLSLW